jgi:N-acetylmuramoyl-L-alanine amidase
MRSLLLALGLFSLAPQLAAAAARPDRTLFQDARSDHQKLQASKRTASRRTEWERVALRYRRVVAKYPQSAYCDDALLAAGDLYRKMAVRFRVSRYNDDAVQAYRMLVAEYPSSSLGEQALFSVFEIASAGGDRKRLAEAARSYLNTFPDSRRARDVKAAVKRTAPEKAAVLPTPPPPGLGQVFNLRFWSGDSSTRVVIDLEREVQLRQDRIAGPDRLWVDLIGTRLHPNLTDRSFPVGDGLLEKIRIGQNRADVVRIVLDFKDVKDHSVVYLKDPTRLLIDVRGAPQPRIADTVRPVLPAVPALPDRVPTRVPSPTPIEDAGFVDLPPETLSAPKASSAVAPAPSPPVPSPTPAALPSPSPTPAPKRAEPSPLPPAMPSPSPVPLPARDAAAPQPTREADAAPQPTREASAAPQPPQVNRAGSYSLARQLGLGARRIVIDPGHGGHDPGTIGRSGLQEKDLVLDVASRLEKMLRSDLGTEVVMTRATDIFIPLEERTAIANSRNADLFLSIHANSSRNPRARGIETYILNFAADPHAEEVAARENAISAATLKDLQGLVKAITLNNKIDESRDFASSIHESLVSRVRASHSEVQDRGVRTAPFYVLIGANMPSVLAEISFVSNPEDERLLRTPDHRDKIARSLFDGVKAYLEGLSRNQTRQLTRDSTGSKVPQRGSRRR